MCATNKCSWNMWRSVVLRSVAAPAAPATRFSNWVYVGTVAGIEYWALSIVRILTGNSLTALESSLLFALLVCSIVRSFGFLYANLRYSSLFVLFLFFFLLNLRVICAKMLRITRMYFNHLFQRWDGLEPISIAHEKRIYALACTDLAKQCSEF